MLDLKKVEGKIICIYGPTASSKSKLAIEFAQKIGGVIINADSMQIYKDVPILTSQPTEHEKEALTHQLYGMANLTTKFSVNEWLKLAINQINATRKLGLSPILVGGTGLYFLSLIRGIAEIPQIEQTTKDYVRSLAAKSPQVGVHKILIDYDSELAQKVSPNDTVRVLRGLEVMIQTGKSILEWQKNNAKFFAETEFFKVYLCPPREKLYSNINQRFLQMLTKGVEDEVRAVFVKHEYQSIVPKIIGLSTIRDYIMHQKDLGTMINEVQKLTRNYAKRQYTWFNNQLKHDVVVDNIF
ncbi:tRNA (adenosine(37)-N6)-dimethylallyltransferase MiaA [Candidatus Bandiella euplotis]|uniref:tRNA dimethylallyltransferase n=1 Tax=Candidatus Bandiella euplotis TaxID=1664265 RepID=A0ABZ0UMT4_9RICK|nr:tRNA (adenosine(37)-N6)-dimethylallyltransferase MiaA [Candidatus Bandiella woodruffii]WPX97024.1 tRNA dimethylallyltransferase [Candidatus Bandiella woodruffii]